MKLAIVGVTGLVGQEMLKVLDELHFEIDTLIPVASERSVGKKISFRGKEWTVVSHDVAIEEKPDIAIFSAGGTVSTKWAPKYAEIGTFVIDNSSAWRMDPKIPLVVPEINADILTKDDKIIANPNCSTIQLVLALAPIHRAYNIERLVISTYQSYTGTGQNAVLQYETEKEGKTAQNPAYPHPIFQNCIPQCDVFLENDYTKEEMKLVNEPRKILRDDSIAITATCVRVPVMGGHSESVNISLSNDFDVNSVTSILNNSKGIVVIDDKENHQYPMPLYSKNKNEVFVGRIRRDESIPNGLNLWIVADNLRKGAATNAVQIAQYLVDQNLIQKH